MPETIGTGSPRQEKNRRRGSPLADTTSRERLYFRSLENATAASRHPVGRAALANVELAPNWLGIHPTGRTAAARGRDRSAGGDRLETFWRRQARSPTSSLNNTRAQLFVLPA